MTTRLQSLRITSDYDPSGFVQGARAQVAAEESLVVAARKRGEALAQADAVADKAVSGVARLSRQFVDGYKGGEAFEAAVRRVGQAFDRGLDPGRATTILEGIYQKYGLVADATKLAEKGFVSLAPIVSDLNARYAANASQAEQAAAATRRMAEAQQLLAERAAASGQRMAQAAQYQAAINQRLGVRDDFGGKERGEDIADLGRRVTDVRDRYVQGSRAAREYREQLEFLRSPLAKVALDEKERAAAIQKTKDQFAAYVVAQRNATNAQNDNIASSKSARSEWTNLIRQGQDLVVTAQMGQPLTTIALQQGMQIADVFIASRRSVGDFARDAISWFGRVFTASRVIVGGIVGIGAAALTAAMQWNSAQRDIDRGMFGAGRASGATRGDINAIADRQSSVFGLSRSEAREFATTIAATGAVAKQNLEPIVAVGKDIARIYGIDATEAAKLLAQAMADPAKGAMELNQRLGNIDAATLRQITNLQAQNRVYEAQALLIDKVRSGTVGISETISTSTNFWTAVGNSISNLWDAIGEKAARVTGVGLVKGLEEEIADSERRIAELEERARRAPLSVLGRIRGQTGQQSGTEAALAAERVNLERNRKALADYQKSAEDAQNARRSFATETAVRALLPEIGAVDQLKNQHTLLNLAFLQVNASGGRNSTLLREWGVSYDQLSLAVETARSRLTTFKTEFERTIDQYNLSIRAVTAYSVAQRGQIAYETAVNQALAQGYNLTRAYVIGLKARELAEKQGREQISEVARERELAARQGFEAAQLELRLVGASTEQQARLRGELQARHQVEQEAARLRQQPDEAHLARLKAQVAETARLKQLEQERKLTSDVGFERSTMFMSDGDRQIAQRLRSIYGDQWAAQMDGAIASQMRFNDNLKITRDLTVEFGTGFWRDFRQQISQGAGAWDAFKTAGLNALNRLNDKLMDMILTNAINKAFGGVLGNLTGSLMSPTSAVASVTGMSASVNSSMASYLGSAHGNVFQNSNVIPFRRGGAFTNKVIDFPTVFPMARGAGLMGEAGPEAVMPLGRTRTGDLGVRVASVANDNASSGDVVVQIINPPAQPKEVRQTRDGQGEASYRGDLRRAASRQRRASRQRNAESACGRQLEATVLSVLLWPADLPQRVMREGFTFSPADARVLTQMESGVDKARRRGGAGRPLRCAITARTRNDMARFDRFWTEETKGGVLPFIIPDQIYDGQPMLDEDGNELTTEDDEVLLISAYWLVMFGREAPTYDDFGPTAVRIGFNLTVMP